MAGNPWMRYGLLAAIVLGFYLAVSAAINLQLDEGAAYPRFSTYRADPQGMRILYESLAALPGIETDRNERTLSLLPLDEPYTFIFTGAVPGLDPEPVIARLEQFVERGGRLIIAFTSRAVRLEEVRASVADETEEDDNGEAEAASEGESPEAEEEGEEEAVAEDADVGVEAETEAPAEEPEDDEDEEERAARLMNLVDVEDRWGFSLDILTVDDFSVDDGGRARFERARDATPSRVQPADDTEGPSLPWRSAFFFDIEDEAWRMHYVYASGEAAVIERDFGEGTIVLMGDTYCLSNESLARDPLSPFLAWLTGPHGRVVFDEWGKGISRDPRIIDLIRRYRLDGVLLALVVTGLLVVWRSAKPLPPRPDRATVEERATHRRGREAQAGLEAFLRRNVPPGALPDVLYAEWAAAFRRDKRYTPAFHERLKKTLLAEGRPLDRYRAAMALIAERNRHRD